MMLQMMPSEPYVGEPVAVVREKSDEDLLLERKLKREEQQKLEAKVIFLFYPTLRDMGGLLFLIHIFILVKYSISICFNLVKS